MLTHGFRFAMIRHKINKLVLNILTQSLKNDNIHEVMPTRWDMDLLDLRKGDGAMSVLILCILTILNKVSHSRQGVKIPAQGCDPEFLCKHPISRCSFLLNNYDNFKFDWNSSILVFNG